MAPSGSGLPPGGTLTFVFTDIEGSTRMLGALGPAYDGVLATHDELIVAAAEAEGGHRFGSEGDAQYLVFDDATAAVRAAAAAQRALASMSWPEGVTVRVRMGIHTGPARRLGDGYVGLTLHETARIAAAGHGGQALVSAATAELVASRLPPGLELVDLGEHRLKDLAQPLRIHQLAGDGLEPTFPPLHSRAVAGAHLPARLTSFVGRAEVEAVVRRLESGRLVTLTGPGGTGKTRLAVEVATAVADRFADGTWFVPLETITEPELVPSEVVAAMGIGSGPDAPLERLLARLEDQTTLLVLDNLEQVTDAGPILTSILARCPGVSMLCTSRIALSVYGEQEFPVPTLTLPAAGTADLATVATSEAVRLFVDRAMAARPDFALGEGNAAAVAEIVHKLDGLPLAIELAAARLKILGVEALRDRLDDRLGLLTGGARDLPARQRTLRGAIEWSHDLLDVPDQRLFARLSVMAGGATFEAAERVCGPSSELGREVFDGIDSLAGQSLVSVADAAGEPRCTMLVTIREYATERLDASDEADVIARRHAEAFVALAEDAAPHLLGPDGQRWNDRLEREHDNIRAAFDWIVLADAAELGLRLVAAVWRFWQVRGHLVEGDRRTHAVLDLPSVAGQPPALRARAESAAGGISYWRSRPESTHRHYRAALEAARAAGDRKLLADALYEFGFATSPEAGDQQVRFTEGRPWFEESLALYRELGDRPGIASSTWALSMSLAAHDDLEGSARLAEQSLELSRELDDPFRTGWAAHLVGLGRLHAKRPLEAASYFRESLEIFEASGDQAARLLLLGDLAVLSEALGEWEPHWRFIGAALRVRDETGVEIWDETTTARFIGWSTRMTPENDEERTWLEAGRALSSDEAVAAARAYLDRD
jgi:predicted ATPase/class 3 adenylate cyclase